MIEKNEVLETEEAISDPGPAQYFKLSHVGHEAGNLGESGFLCALASDTVQDQRGSRKSTGPK